LAVVLLENLIGNAWKFSKNREEAIIEFGVGERVGMPTYFVRDNGIGFDVPQEGKLFAPFQRLPGSGDYSGHGIGLATVKRIIESHGGRIWAESREGEGATFFFTLAGVEGSENQCSKPK
jgi:light-regulated signal transduction histidine kinase (bacteriophytochrome)